MITKAICYLQAQMAGDSGASMVEYAIMVGLIAIVSILVVTALGQSVGAAFDTANTNLQPNN